MVAPLRTKKIFCTIVRVEAVEDLRNESPNRDVTSNRFSTRPSRLLPWADPYIAKLVRNLQEEVRSERRVGASERADLDPPSPATDTDGGLLEETRWNLWDDSYSDLPE